MVFDYLVKHNGEYYEPGEDVPIEEDLEAEGENSLPFESGNEKIYTKTEINRMSTAELQNLAAEVGIDNAFETSGSRLKEKLIEHYGL